MAKELQSGSRVDAEKWEKGKIVRGFFVGREQFDGCSSPLLTFDRTGANDLTAAWETAALGRYKLELGKYYRIECDGKKTYAKGEGWSLRVFELDETETKMAQDEETLKGSNKA